MSSLNSHTRSVLKAVEKYGPVRSSELVIKLKISSKNLYKHLGKLLDERLIKKIGSTPKVFYSMSDDEKPAIDFMDVTDLFIEQNYIYVSPSGDILRGVYGFKYWCEKNKFSIEKHKKLFVSKLKLINKMKKDGVISAKNRILSSEKSSYLNNLYYNDFYTVDHYGKTKLGQLVYMGKSAQNKNLIMEISDIIKSNIDKLIKKHQINMIGFIPPTIERKTQFLEYLKKYLDIPLPEISIDKVSTPTKVAQKTLRKLEDRITNAKTSIAVNPTQKISGSVLLIDDAVGSGATLNETAGKIKKIATSNTKVFGFSVVGSFKGFDVISEV